jgi:hypothetical protein
MPKEMDMSPQMGMSMEMRVSNGQGGHLHMQTNEIRNAIIHHYWSANGAITEAERIPSGGARSGKRSTNGSTLFHVLT